MTTKVPIELSSTPSIVDGGNATAITIDSSERVGIGTASPSRPLTINKNDQCDVTIRSANDQSAQLLFGDQAADNQGAIQYNNTTDSMSLNTNGGTRMHITSAGNVGLGTASPSSSAGWGTLLEVSGTTNAGIKLTETDTANGDYSLGVTAGTLRIWDEAASAFRVTLDGSGNVGIGTSSPDSDARLHVKGTTAHTYSTVEANSGVSAASKYISGSNAWRVGIDTTCGADGDLVFANTESGTPIYGKFESDGDFQIHTSDSGIGRMGHIKTKYVTLADDGLISLGSGTTCGAWQVHVYERGSGAGAIFHCDYDGTTILVNQFVAGGAGFSNSNADGYYGLYKGDNSHTVYFQNRNGASRTFHIMVYGAEV